MNISREELAALEELRGLNEFDQFRSFEEARYACFLTPGMNSRWLKTQLLLVSSMLVFAALIFIVLLRLGLGVELFLLMIAVIMAAQYGLRKYSRRKYVALVRPFLKKDQRTQ